ncbi:MAG: DUF4360 domain-containing protein, partial [Bdellovibrionota bacterium]
MRHLILIPFLISVLVGSVWASSPSDVRLGNPVMGGDGCVDPVRNIQTASAVLSDDRTSLSILYDAYSAQAGRNFGKTFERKHCDLVVPLQVPAGYEVSVMQVDYRGFAAIPQGGSGRFRAEYFFAGEGRGIVTEQRFAPGAMTEYLVPNNLTVESWSTCGASVNLRVNSSIIAQSNVNGDEAQVTVDSTDANIRNKYGVIFHLSFRACGSGSMPNPQPQPLPPQPMPQPNPPIPGVF